MKWRRRRFQRLRKKARQQQAMQQKIDKAIGQMVNGLKRRFKPLFDHFDHVERIKQETKP